MALSNGQLSGLGTISTRLPVSVPPGQCQVALTPVAGTVYVGFGTSATTSNGFLLPAGGYSIYGYNGSSGAPLSVIATGTAAAVSWFISTAQTVGP